LHQTRFSQEKVNKEVNKGVKVKKNKRITIKVEVRAILKRKRKDIQKLG
jgi:hypothetical protein